MEPQAASNRQQGMWLAAFFCQRRRQAKSCPELGSRWLRMSQGRPPGPVGKLASRHDRFDLLAPHAQDGYVILEPVLAQRRRLTGMR